MPLQGLINSLKALESIVFQEIFNNPAMKRFIIALNTDAPKDGQLFEKGIDSRGISLESIGGPYSPFTIEVKLQKGQRVDHVTLKDTGEFYESFRVQVDKDFFTIDANPMKDDTNLFTEWGEDILGLTDENLQILINSARQQLTEIIRRRLTT